VTEQPTPTGPAAPRPVPDLGFFAPVGPVRSQQPPPTQHAVPPNQFAPPPSQFAAPPSPFAAPPSPFGAPLVTPFGTAPPAYATYPAVQQRGGIPGWLIALIAVVVGFVIIAVLAAVAIPVFLDQRAKATAAGSTIPEAPAIVLPATVEGLSRSTDPEVQARMQSLLRGLPSAVSDGQGAIYTDGSAHTIVLMSARFAHRVGPAEMSNVMAGFDNGLVSNAPPGVTMSKPFDREPGRIGGRLRCATMSGAASGQVCMSADSTSMLSISAVSPGRPDPDLPLRVREAVILRQH
jgi:hypothetical protein